MRIFIALDIDDAIRQRIRRFLEGVSGFAPDARWVRPESLHVTLKFIGEKPIETVEEIKRALSGITAGSIEISFRGYGFFPTAKAARVFWIGIESGPALSSLATAVDETTFALGVPKEDHPFTPHLTLARGGAGRRSGSLKPQKGDGPNTAFATLETRLAAMSELDFGTMTAHEFILYQSELSPGGSKYTKMQQFPMRRR